MEVTIARSELIAGLYLVQGIVERRNTLPVLNNVLMQASADGLSLAATDQEVSVRRLCSAAVKKKGTLTTGARKLYEMVREFPEGDVRIRSLDNNWIEVAAGRSRFKLVGMDPREFPAMPEPASDKATLQISGAMLSEMIEHTVFAVSSDESRVNLSGIFIECVEPGKLRFVATDGHRLALVTRAVEGADLEKGVILPRKAVAEIRKVLESGEESISISVEGGLAHLWRGPVRMSMRLIDGEFPDYRQVIPSKPERFVSIPVPDLLAALRRVSIVSIERTRGIKLQLEGPKLEITSINPDIGEATEEIEVDYEGPAVGVGFNARYLMDALNTMPADGRVELGLTDEVSPGVVAQAGDPDYCYIVMPMRL
jgi:DNA polymerase III subunit beta